MYISFRVGKTFEYEINVNLKVSEKNIVRSKKFNEVTHKISLCFTDGRECLLKLLTQFEILEIRRLDDLI